MTVSMIMQKKSQAAMEFLMTYGWAILIVIISIGALAYFGVLNPARFLPSSCVLFPGLACTDAIVTKNTVTLVVSNGLGSNVDVQQLRLTSGGSNICGAPVIDQKVEDGSRIELTVAGCQNGEFGTRFKADINVDYSTSSGVSHSKVGSIISQVEDVSNVNFNPITNTYSGTPDNSQEEDSTRSWGPNVLKFPLDGNFLTAIDQGIVVPDFVILNFPDLGIPSTKTISSGSFLMNHKEDVISCDAFTPVTDDEKHSVECYDYGIGDWINLGPYPIQSSFGDSLSTLSTACINNVANANRVRIKVKFDPPTDPCGNLQMEYAEVRIVAT